MAYRISRNIEASIVEFITASLLSDSWSGIEVLKGFPQEYKGKIPFIGVEVLNIDPVKLEIGNKNHVKNFTVKIGIFSSGDGKRLDLSDWLFDKLEDDVDYYTYTITNGVITSKVKTGKIIITKWNNNEKELTNTEVLEEEDRYRHLLNFECIVAL